MEETAPRKVELDAPVFDVRFAAAGSLLVTVSGGPVLRLWDVVSLKSDRALPLAGDVTGGTLSPDGHHLCLGSRDGSVTLIDGGTLKPVRKLKAGTVPVTLLDFSRDGSVVAAGGEDGALRLFRRESGVLLAEARERVLEVGAVAFSPDGRLLAAGGPEGDVAVFDTATGALRVKLTDPLMAIFCLAFSPDGKLLAASGPEKAIRLWETGTWKVKPRLVGHTNPVAALAFSPDGRLLQSAGTSMNPGTAETQARVWDVAAGSAIARGLGIAGVSAVAFTAAGQALAASAQGKTVTVWSLS